MDAKHPGSARGRKPRQGLLNPHHQQVSHVSVFEAEDLTMTCSP